MGGTVRGTDNHWLWKLISTAALGLLRHKVENKLDHELEDGWRVAWEECGTRGKTELVFYDPLAPGVKLLVGTPYVQVLESS